MDIMLPARDGVNLAATLFEPNAAPETNKSGGGAVLINSGTGIPRQFYATFAAHLAACGFTVMTYDYRGIGGSESPRGATMEDWGAIDQPSMLDHLARWAPGTRLAVVGHSFGGQVLGLADNISSVRAVVLICAQSGHWRHWPLGKQRLRVMVLWWLLIPSLTALIGRFPGSWFGTANLPSDIARTWARWGRSRHYVSDRRGGPLRPFNDDVAMPIRWLSFSDDPIAPFGAVEALRSYYPNAAIERRHQAPADLGLDAIGHFGFFRKSMPRRPWDDLASWLEHHLLESRAPSGQTGGQSKLEDQSACPHRTFSPKSKTASAG